MRIVATPKELQSSGCTLVPTMGALHAGHLSLIRLAAQQHTSPVVVSIFVNPTQFNDPTDLARYPRTFERDAKICADAGADVLFAPSVETMYPPDEPMPAFTVPPVAIDPLLEDAGRPGHFAGVCQVVSRLFDLCDPSQAVFGEKDWQQLQTVRLLIQIERRPINIVPGPIVRDPDGLALSSRNRHLTPEDRTRARALSLALAEASNHPRPADAEAAMRSILESVEADIQYATVRDARTLMPLDPHTDNAARALVCAVIGGVRLLDNAPWTPAR